MQPVAQAKYLDNIKSLFQTGTVRQLAFMIGIAISVALGIVLYMSIQEPIYRPLDYQVTAQNMATIIDTLEKANIQYKLNEKDGVIYVAAKDLQNARMKLSATGVPKDDSFNYSFLNEQTNLGNSQFIENARYLRALESDLSKTISSIEGVSAARVHIAVPENSVFADENNKTTASVVLNTTPAFASDREKIGAIVQIIADSVTGLDPKDVAITDQYGHFLSSGLDQELFNTEQLNYQNNVQSYYEKRIESMIVPILGENKVSVRVYADIDFTQQEEAVESYDPDKKVIRSEETDSEQSDSSGASGAPGSLSNSPPSEGDSDKHGGGGSSGGQGKNQSIKNYELSKSVNYKKDNFARIKSLSVAVVVDNQVVIDPKTKQEIKKPLDADQIAKITELVKASIGYDQAKGDKVTVVNSSFNQVKQDIVMPIQHIWDQAWFWDVLKRTVAILFGFTFLLVIYRKLSNYMGIIPQPKVKEPLKQLEELPAGEAPVVQNQKADRLNQLKELATTDPDRVASIIKNWVGKQ